MVNMLNFPGLPLFPYDYANKEKCINDYANTMLNRTQSMFRWGKLPPDIPARNLELMLQTTGWLCYTDKPDGKLRIFTGGLGGELDYLYMPTLCTVANPALSFSASLKIGEECIIMPNDSLYQGFLPIFSRYATFLTETDLSIWLATINSRATTLISAPDDRTVESAEIFLQQLFEGDLAVVAETPFFDGIKTQPYADGKASQSIISLLELKNSLFSMWLNEIGLQSNPNQKREYVNEAEISMPGDALLPLIDDALRCRKRAVEQINEMYGTEITVELNSAWEDNKIQVANSLYDEDGDGDTMDDKVTEDEMKVIEETKSDEIQQEVEDENISADEEENKEEKESEEEDEDKE